MPIGGALKLKGGEPLKPAGGVKKKKKAASKDSDEKALTRLDSSDGQQAAQLAVNEAGTPEQDLKRVLRGYELKQPAENEDRRTEAEKRFEQQQIKLEQDRLKKLAKTSHRDRVKAFNEQLANLSEHHDIPRVGPG